MDATGSARARKRLLRVHAIASLPLIPGLAIPLASGLVLFANYSRANSRRAPITRTLILFSLLGAGAFLISAATNSVAISTTGVGNYLVFLSLMFVLRAWTTRIGDAVSYVGFLCLVTAVYFVALRPDQTAQSWEHLWKYGLAIPLTAGIVWVLGRRESGRRFIVPVLGALAVFGVLLDSRANGLVCAVAASVILVRGANSGKSRAVRTAVALVLALLVAFALPAAISAGLLGGGAQARTLHQEEVGPLVLGGRTEAPLSLAAIEVHPWLGWGNAQSLDTSTISRGAEIATNLGMGSPSSYLPFWIRADGTISLHSILLQAWVEGGVVAALLPLALLGVFGLSVARVSGASAPLVTYVGVVSGWTLIFSPWSNQSAVLLAGFSILACWALDSAGGAGALDRGATLRELRGSRSRSRSLSHESLESWNSVRRSVVVSALPVAPSPDEPESSWDFHFPVDPFTSQ